ncbi:hypothetical protein [Granulicella pectinivorans]|uniref:hypothetical protein n=1 Tax=Granulicella pectinivorans TaxID=474950 RepID=UPI0015878586|nr:hypothetical protein [Granulicella pectinivorans]
MSTTIPKDRGVEMGRMPGASENIRDGFIEIWLYPSEAMQTKVKRAPISWEGDTLDTL